MQARADYGSVEGTGEPHSDGADEVARDKRRADRRPEEIRVGQAGGHRERERGELARDAARRRQGARQHLYARDASRPAVFTVESALADDLKKGADDYRRKDLFDLRAYNTSRFEITRGGQTIVFEMTKGTGENAPNKWKRVSPNPADVDHDKTEAFLTKLSNLRALSFVDTTAKTGLDNPVMSVRAKFEDTKEDAASFGKAGNDVYAAHPGEPGAAKVDTTDFDDVLKALDEVAK